MHLLIVEDEASMARRLQRILVAMLGNQITSLTIVTGVAAALNHFSRRPVNLMFLDLNLNGKDGFTILQSLLAESFDVIVVSAYRDRALEAFDYGVLDFVAKPFSKERLHQAVNRYLSQQGHPDRPLRRLAVKKQGKLTLIEVSDILFVQGADIYTTLHLRPRPLDKRMHPTELSDKSLESLSRLLPSDFVRVHKSYIVNLKACKELLIEGGGRYALLLNDGRKAPVGRTRYQEVRERFL
ncbi:MAG: two-component system response regulator LytT [Neolewinella sp.]